MEYKLEIHDVGLRDGLQMIEDAIPTDTKIRWAEHLIDAGIKYIQLGSFVNPKVLYQMSDTDDLFEELLPGKPEGVILSGLVLNGKGMERALKCNADMICLGVSASETHSKKNTNMTVSEATEKILKLAKVGIDSDKVIQASVQSAFGCGYEGRIDFNAVLGIVRKYIDAGVKIVSLADTAGHATPNTVNFLINEVRYLDSEIRIAVHFHDTYGMGMANILTAHAAGAELIETSFGGLGGCPFTKSPSGNVATEDAVNMFKEMGYLEEVSIDKLISLTKFVSGYLVKDLPGKIYKTGTIPKKAQN